MTLSLLAAIEHWPLDRLVPHARNARTHSEDQIAQIAGSIAEFGFVNPSPPLFPLFLFPPPQHYFTLPFAHLLLLLTSALPHPHPYPPHFSLFLLHELLHSFPSRITTTCIPR